MRKMLIALTLALTAAAVSSTSSAAAATRCPKDTRPMDCGTSTICCPNGAFCFCPYQ